jgi:CRP-like cAMP-binding protein
MPDPLRPRSPEGRLVSVRRSNEILTGLSRSYLFEDMTAGGLEPLAALATTRRLVRGESVWRVGDPADEVYLVLSGEVKDSVVDADGYEVIHFVHGPGMTLRTPATSGRSCPRTTASTGCSRRTLN